MSTDTRSAERRTDDHPACKPDWLRVRLPTGETFQDVRRLMRSKELHTVCEEAMCPNIGECWGRGTATFLLLGDTCTRSCAFCNISTGRPGALDEDEPQRIAQAVKAMHLKHAVLTSVNRDEQPDGGAHIFARSVWLIHEQVPGCTVEVLIPDFKGDRAALQLVMDVHPEVLNHNVETVPRLYRTIRPQAIYERSLDLLMLAKEMDSQATIKSGMMVGVGETWDEVIQVMRDLRAHQVEVLTIGQYLRPSPHNVPVARYWTPDEFLRLGEAGAALGFKWVESAPLVRSSYHADAQAEGLSVTG